MENLSQNDKNFPQTLERHWIMVSSPFVINKEHISLAHTNPETQEREFPWWEEQKCIWNANLQLSNDDI